MKSRIDQFLYAVTPNDLPIRYEEWLTNGSTLASYLKRNHLKFKYFYKMTFVSA